MKTTYYNRSSKYYTKHSDAKRKGMTVVKYTFAAAIALVIYAFAYIVLVATGAQY